MSFGDRLRALRKAAGLSSEALARRLGMTRRSVAGWESGETAPNLAALEKLDESGFDFVYLVAGQTSPEYAARHIDVGAIVDLVRRVDAHCAQDGIELSSDEMQRVVRHLYLQRIRAPEAFSARDQIRETFELMKGAEHGQRSLRRA